MTRVWLLSVGGWCVCCVIVLSVRVAAICCFFFFFFKQKTAYEMRISDWSSDVCSSDLLTHDGTDAAIHTAAGGNPANWMGAAGAWFADLGLFVGGVPIVLLLPRFGVMAWRLWAATAQPYWKRQFVAMGVAIMLVGLGAQPQIGRGHVRTPLITAPL